MTIVTQVIHAVVTIAVMVAILILVSFGKVDGTTALVSILGTAGVSIPTQAYISKGA